MERLDPKDLTDAYHRLRESAPHRHERNKSYFVGHSGITSSGKASNRREEHLAVALFNASQEGVPLKLPDGSSLKFLDYQLPLKARQGDKGIGKVDLFGVINGTQSSVIELKIHPAGTGYGDTPLRAFLEALAYCAIVEANADDVASESLYNFNLKLKVNRPSLIVLAPEQYWKTYHAHRSLPRRLMNLPKRLLMHSRRFNNARYELDRWQGSEELFLIKRASHYYPDYQVPSVAEALKFAFEILPRHCYELNHHELPFGCHAWERYDKSFWEPYLLT